MKFTTRLVPIAFFLLAVHISLSHQKSQSFGQVCSSSERCDSRRGTVSCNLDSQRCDCRDPETMEYDEKSGECVSIAGASCFVRPLRNRSVRNCVAGAVCAPVSSKSLFGTCVAVEPKSDNDENDMALFADSSSSTQGSEDEDTGATSEQPEVNTGNTSEQPEENTGATSEQPEENTGATSEQPEENTGATSEQPEENTGETSEQPEENTGATSEQPEENTGSTPEGPEENTGSTVEPRETTTEEIEEPEKLPIGEECTSNDECIEHATCPTAEGNNKRTCKCGEEFPLSQDGGFRCAKGIDASCTVDAECLSNAHCMPGDKPHCMCNENFGAKDNLCAPHIDQPCSIDDDATTPACYPEDSICLEKPDNSTVCACSDSFSPSADKKECNSAITNVINLTLLVLLASSSYIVNKFNH